MLNSILTLFVSAILQLQLHDDSPAYLSTVRLNVRMCVCVFEHLCVLLVQPIHSCAHGLIISQKLSELRGGSADEEVSTALGR